MYNQSLFHRKTILHCDPKALEAPEAKGLFGSYFLKLSLRTFLKIVFYKSSLKHREHHFWYSQKNRVSVLFVFFTIEKKNTENHAFLCFLCSPCFSKQKTVSFFNG